MKTLIVAVFVVAFLVSFEAAGEDNLLPFIKFTGEQKHDNFAYMINANTALINYLTISGKTKEAGKFKESLQRCGSEGQCNMQKSIAKKALLCQRIVAAEDQYGGDKAIWMTNSMFTCVDKLMRSKTV